MSNIAPFRAARENTARLHAEPRARFYLFGMMRAVSAAGEDLLPHSRKSRALLAYMCMAEGERVSRSRLAALLWDRSTDLQARMSLRHALSEINNGTNYRVPGLVEIDREWVRLDPRSCWIDALTVSESSERLLDGFDRVSSAFDHWLAAERIRFEDRVRIKFEEELNELVESGAAPEARAAAARKLVNFEPTHESAVRSLMTAFVQMGDRAQALREYERCRSALRQILDLRPSKQTVALYEAIRVTGQTSGKEPAQPPLADAGAGSDGLDASKPSRPEAAEKPSSLFQADRATQASIAVLPFRNMSADPAHEYAADGLVEDLTEALSRIPTFFVISRLSSLAFKGQDRPPQEIGETLGVRYVLSGSMRIMGNHLRLTAELTDTSTGIPLWISKLDEQFFDILEVQNRLAEAIAGRIAPYLHATEVKRARMKQPERLEVYDFFLRAQENMHNSSREVFESSEKLFDHAIERQPNCAAALAWRAYWHVLRVGQGWSPDPALDAEQADRFAQRAVDCDVLEPMAFAVQGHVASYLHKNFDLAFSRFETALRVNPNAAPAWVWSAAAHAWIGNGSRAIEEINRAMALSPYDPLMYAFTGVAGVAFLADGQYERAVECGLRCVRENKTYTSAYKLLLIALALAGRAAEVQAPLRQLMDLDPEFTVNGFRKQFPGGGFAHGELYCDALSRIGVPLD